MDIVIGVVSPNLAWVLPHEHVAWLEQRFPRHRFVAVWDRAALRTALPNADAAFAAYLDRDLVPGLRRLKWLQAPAVGVSHILSSELRDSPIVLTNARGIRTRAIAEHVLALILALSRQIHAAVRRQQVHAWPADGIVAEAGMRTLGTAQLGIVGLGSIGTEVARLAAPLVDRIAAVRRHPERPVPAEVAEVLPPKRLDKLLAASDVVVLSAPLTEETEHLIGSDEIRQMKRGALLINIGRGQLIDDGALVRALEEGWIGGAGLDVFSNEPLSATSPYWRLPNVIVTPHVSGAMEDYWTPLVALFAENLQRFERGEPLLNVVDKHVGY